LVVSCSTSVKEKYCQAWKSWGKSLCFVNVIIWHFEDHEKHLYKFGDTVTWLSSLIASYVIEKDIKLTDFVKNVITCAQLYHLKILCGIIKAWGRIP